MRLPPLRILTSAVALAAAACGGTQAGPPGAGGPAMPVAVVTRVERPVQAQQTARNAEVQAALAEDRLRQARLDLLVALGRFP